MLRKYFPYSLVVLKLNILISICTSFFGTIINGIPEKGVSKETVFYLFSISFLSGGFLTGALYFELAHKREYYLYYNLGISRLRLIAVSYFFHAMVLIPVLMIFHYA